MRQFFLIISILLAVLFVQAEPSSSVEVMQNNEIDIQRHQSDGEFGSEFKIIPSQLSKSELWINAKKWISSSFKDYQHAVDLEDKESGTIILKFSCSKEAGNPFITYIISATLKLDIRDNKYRYTFSDVIFSLEPNDALFNQDLNYWPKHLLERSQIYLKAAEVILLRSRTVDPSLKNDVFNYKNALANTKKFKNEKDAKKNKVTNEYKTAEALYEIIQSIETGYSLMQLSVSESLQDAMNFKDDF